MPGKGRKNSLRRTGRAEGRAASVRRATLGGRRHACPKARTICCVVSRGVEWLARTGVCRGACPNRRQGNRPQRGAKARAFVCEEAQPGTQEESGIGFRLTLLQLFSFQYPLSGARWTFCSFSSRLSAVTTASGRFRNCSAKSLSLTTTSPVGNRW